MKALTIASASPSLTTKPGLSTAALVTMALLSALGPAGIDLYLVAFPRIAMDLHTTIGAVQLSLTTFLVGAGAGQLLFGPLSDWCGRRRTLMVGLFLLLLGSVWSVLASDITQLVTARGLQGLGAASGMVIGRAIIADRTSGRETARAMNLVLLMTGIAPVVAPVAGSVLVPFIGWRGLLGLIVALGVVALLLVAITVGPDGDRLEASVAGIRLGRWAVQPAFLGYMLAYGLSLSAMLAYVATSPFIYQQVLGFTAIEYGLAFAVTASALATVTWLSNRLVAHLTPRTIAGAGLGISAIFSIAAVAWTILGGTPLALVIFLPLIVAPLGLVFGNTATLALQAVPRSVTGLGSAVLGATQFALAGLTSALAGIGHSTTTVLVVVGASIVLSIVFTLAAMFFRPRNTSKETK